MAHPLARGPPPSEGQAPRQQLPHDARAGHGGHRADSQADAPPLPGANPIPIPSPNPIPNPSPDPNPNPKTLRRCQADRRDLLGTLRTREPSSIQQVVDVHRAFLLDDDAAFLALARARPRILLDHVATGSRRAAPGSGLALTVTLNLTLTLALTLTLDPLTLDPWPLTLGP